VISRGGGRAFVTANTEITCPPLVPEIRLRLASELLPIWQVTEQVLNEMGVEPPYWAFCWPGGQALARFLLDHPEHVRGRTVLDFAAGCGIAGIAAAQAGAAVSASEIDGLALAAIELNAALNQVSVRLESDNLLVSTRAEWDVILAGDVCYERGLADAVMTWFGAHARRGVEVLLADPGRAYLPTSGLEAVERYVVPTSLELEDRESRDCVVWRLRADCRKSP
jgi:predicted nicotinamide N-methyase